MYDVSEKMGLVAERCSPGRGTLEFKLDWKQNGFNTCSNDAHAQIQQNKNWVVSSTSIFFCL